MDTASSSGIMAGILWFVQGIFYSALNISLPFLIRSFGSTGPTRKR